jgi:hypothetical protein
MDFDAFKRLFCPAPAWKNQTLVDEEAARIFLLGFPSIRSIAGLVAFRSQAIAGEKHRDRGPYMFADFDFGHRRWRLSDQGLQMMLRDHRAEKEFRGAERLLAMQIAPAGRGTQIICKPSQRYPGTMRIKDRGKFRRTRRLGDNDTEQ